MYKAWDKACQAAGCPGKLFHDFRRTAARNLRSRDLEVPEAMKIMGHKTASMFTRYNIGTESELAAVRAKGAFLAQEPSRVGQKLAKDGVPKKGRHLLSYVESVG